MDAGLVRTYLQQNPSAVHELARVAPAGTDLTPSVTPVEISKIGFVGLGAMGQGMAASLVRSGFRVHGYDVHPPSVEKFITSEELSTAASSPADAAEGADVFILMVQNAAQAEDVLFGAGKAAETLPTGSTVILMSTVPPSFVRTLAERINALQKNIALIDAPVSGGVVRAAKGELTVSDKDVTVGVDQHLTVLVY